MTRLLLRYRRTLILSSALLLSFVLMTLQVRSQSALTDFTKRILLTTISPFLRIAAVGKATTVNLWKEYIDLRRIRRDNQLLTGEVRQLRVQVGELWEAAQENSRLNRLLEMGSHAGTEAVTARVIGKDVTNWFRTILIDKGTMEGIQRHMAVVAPEGLVGRVVDVTTRAARVQLITDPESAIGCLIQRSRVAGVAAGSQSGTVQMRYLPLMADVVVGDRVITSGMGGILPKGIPLGKVVRSSRPNGALFQETEVHALADFSRLEEVMVLRRPPEHDRSWGGGKHLP
ncbi:MAG TPA: rod shape-determining protein MreC [Candidatus Methylomirabilis sp.]|nr:rod shape-determining protein MreC [Candidatus Methylomirabilis sp.]